MIEDIQDNTQQTDIIHKQEENSTLDVTQFLRKPQENHQSDTEDECGTDTIPLQRKYTTSMSRQPQSIENQEQQESNQSESEEEE